MLAWTERLNILNQTQCTYSFSAGSSRREDVQRLECNLHSHTNHAKHLKRDIAAGITALMKVPSTLEEELITGPIMRVRKRAVME